MASYQIMGKLNVFGAVMCCFETVDGPTMAKAASNLSRAILPAAWISTAWRSSRGLAASQAHGLRSRGMVKFDRGLLRRGGLSTQEGTLWARPGLLFGALNEADSGVRTTPGDRGWAQAADGVGFLGETPLVASQLATELKCHRLIPEGRDRFRLLEELGSSVRALSDRRQQVLGREVGRPRGAGVARVLQGRDSGAVLRPVDAAVHEPPGQAGLGCGSWRSGPSSRGRL